MADREKVIKGLECCTRINENCMPDCDQCPYKSDPGAICGVQKPIKDALELLKAQEQRHRLEVHNIGNVDIPDGVTFEQFQAVMNGVIDALEHTEKGESWPYEEPPKEG